jgi:hypothetical protein
VAKTTVGSDIDQPLDVHGDFLTKITFHLAAVLNHVADCCDLTFREIAGFDVSTDIGLITNLASSWATNAEDIGESDINALVAWKIHTFNTCHDLSLPLFVLWDFADDTQNSASFYDAALVADLLYGSSYFHFVTPLAGLTGSSGVLVDLTVENSENLCSVRGDGDGVFEVCSEAAIRGYHRPKVV